MNLSYFEFGRIHYLFEECQVEKYRIRQSTVWKLSKLHEGAGLWAPHWWHILSATGISTSGLIYNLNNRSNGKNGGDDYKSTNP